ncbi:MAG: YtxH domain-containing protein [Thermonemataceae bacterium]
MESNRKKDHFLLGVFLGAATGTLLGLLYAPQDGKVTRKKLTYQLTKLREKLQVYLQDLAEGKEEHVSLARTQGQKVVTEAKQKAEQLLRDVESLMEQVKP